MKEFLSNLVLFITVFSWAFAFLRINEEIFKKAAKLFDDVKFRQSVFKQSLFIITVCSIWIMSIASLVIIVGYWW